MAPIWKLRLYDQAGDQVAELDRWPSLVVHREVNKAGTYALELPGDDPKVALFEQDGLLEAWWTDAENGIAWQREFVGWTINCRYWTDEDNAHHFISSGCELADLLDRTIIHTYAGSAESDKSGVGETVIKEFVDEQAGPGAGARARSGLTIQADAAAGGNWEGQRSNRNLLTVIQDIADVTGLLFGIERTGAYDFEFQVWTPTDRTATVIFSEELGNMGQPELELRRSEVRNWIKVGGQGEGAARTFAYVSDAASIALTPQNQRELFLQGTDQTTVAGLQDRGNERLAENAKTWAFTFKPLQMPGLLYGRDYFLGDLVSARYRGVTYTMRVESIEFRVDADGVGLDVGMKYVAVGP